MQNKFMTFAKLNSLSTTRCPSCPTSVLYERLCICLPTSWHYGNCIIIIIIIITDYSCHCLDIFFSSCTNAFVNTSKLEWLTFYTASEFWQQVLAFYHNARVWQTDRQNFNLQTTIWSWHKHCAAKNDIKNLTEILLATERPKTEKSVQWAIHRYLTAKWLTEMNQVIKYYYYHFVSPWHTYEKLVRVNSREKLVRVSYRL